MRITGLSGLLTGDYATFIALQPRTAPGGKSIAEVGRIFRHLLRGLLDCAVLAAAGLNSDNQARIISLYARNRELAASKGVNLQVPPAAKAAAWLTGLLTDLISGPHAYLLPCEAVFYEYYKRQAGKPDPDRLQFYIHSLAENERASFSSLWGPVPLPRRYKAPAKPELETMVEKRFGLLLGSINGLEGI